MKKIILVILIAVSVVHCPAQSLGTEVRMDTVKGWWDFNYVTLRKVNGRMSATFEFDMKDSTKNNRVVRPDVFTMRDSLFNIFYNNWNSGHYLGSFLYAREGLTPIDSNRFDSIFINRPPYVH